jgi:hypothetical protein
MMHEADEPNAVVDFLDTELLSREHGGEVDPLAMQAEAAAGGDDDVAIAVRILPPQRGIPGHKENDFDSFGR